jgi:hypothetical protein
VTRVRVDGTGGGRVPVQVRRLVALEVTDRDLDTITQALSVAADMSSDGPEVYAELAATLEHRVYAYRNPPVPGDGFRLVAGPVAPTPRGTRERLADLALAAVRWWNARLAEAPRRNVLYHQAAAALGPGIPFVVLALTGAPAVGFLTGLAAFTGYGLAIPFLAREEARP